MGRLINIDALREAFRHDIMGGLNWDRILKEAKTVDAVPVRHGRWNGGADDASCSACGRNLLDFFSYTEYCGVYEYPKFCPNCGARMDGDDGQI